MTDSSSEAGVFSKRRKLRAPRMVEGSVEHSAERTSSHSSEYKPSSLDPTLGLCSVRLIRGGDIGAVDLQLRGVEEIFRYGREHRSIGRSRYAFRTPRSWRHYDAQRFLQWLIMRGSTMTGTCLEKTRYGGYLERLMGAFPEQGQLKRTARG